MTNVRLYIVTILEHSDYGYVVENCHSLCQGRHQAINHFHYQLMNRQLSDDLLNNKQQANT
ncbi:MAG: hypothetical protein AAF629_19670 [Chloroflexota bacterium]